MEYIGFFIKATGETLLITLISTIFAYAFGLPLGVFVVITSKEGIWPHSTWNKILGIIINIGRSIPFIILLVVVMPLTRFLVGTTIGAVASTVPLIVAAIPFVARLVESSLKELDRGIIEAAEAMGANTWQIIYKVMIPECMPSLVLGVSLTTITLIGYSAMAGAMGGGGLGDLAIRYGYYRYQTWVAWITIALLIGIVQLVQGFGNKISNKIDKRKKGEI